MKNYYSGKGGPRLEDLLGRKVAVILIGMQESFIKKLKQGEADRIITNQLTVLNLCRQLGVPVVVLEIKKEMHGETAEVLMNEARKNARFLSIDSEHNDSFSGTGLDLHLKHLEAEELLLMGIYDYACIKYTAETAIKKGYKIITSDEVIAGPYYRKDDNMDQWFKKKGAWLMDIGIFPEALAA